MSFGPFSSASPAWTRRGFHSGFGYGGWHPWRRAPSRIVWFLVGAASATLWIKHKEHHVHQHYGRCRRLRADSIKLEQELPLPEAVSADPSHGMHRVPWHQLPHPSAPGKDASAAREREGAQVPAQPPLTALKSAFDEWEKGQDRMIENEKEHMAKVSRQAVDTVRHTVLPMISFE